MASTPSIEAPIKAANASAPKQGKTSQHEKAAKLQWQQLLHAHLEREKRYPRKAKRLRKQGMPVIRFTMDREGNVLDVILIRSSGTQSLDQEAIDLVFRAQPLIKPPSSVSGSQTLFNGPDQFFFLVGSYYQYDPYTCNEQNNKNVIKGVDPGFKRSRHRSISFNHTLCHLFIHNRIRYHTSVY